MYYVYKLISPIDNKVFYVGKGKKDRMYIHVSLTKRDKVTNGNIYLYRKLKKILEEYDDILYEKVFETENEIEAYEHELKVINDIGVDNLCNISLSYNLLADETKVKISESLKEKWKNDKEFSEKINNTRKTEEYKKNMSNVIKNSDNHKKAINKEEYKRKKSKSTKEWWNNLSEDEYKEYCENMSNVIKNSDNHKKAIQSEEYRKNLSKSIIESDKFKEYNENRKGVKRGKYKETIKNINRRKKSALFDGDDIIKEFKSLSDVCEYFDIKISTACVWIKKQKNINGFILKSID
jgi:hypothetical protein